MNPEVSSQTPNEESSHATDVANPVTSPRTVHNPHPPNDPAKVIQFTLRTLTMKNARMLSSTVNSGKTGTKMIKLATSLMMLRQWLPLVVQSSEDVSF